MRPVSKWLGGLAIAGLLCVSLASVAGGAAIDRGVGPGGLDPSCNHGRGLQLRVPNFENGDLAAAITLKAGVVLIAFSPPSNAPNGLDIYAVTPDCTIDSAFGVHGELSLSPIGGPGSSLQTIIPAINGDVLVFGDAVGKLIATELTPEGQIVRSFGHNGWVVQKLSGWEFGLTQGPYVDAVSQAANGMIIIGGDDGQPHCCDHSLVYELTSDGHLVDTFGRGGVVHVFGQGAYIDQVLPEPGGSTLVVGQIIYAGCGGMYYVSLNAAGKIEAAITANLTRTTRSLPHSQWSNSKAYLGPDNKIGLVGVGSRGCFGPSRQFAYNEQLTHLGTLDPGGHRIYFKPIERNNPTLAAASDGRVFLSTVDPNWTVLALREFLPSGAVDAGFGHNGVLSLRLNPSINLIPLPMLTPGPAGDVDVVIPELAGPKLLEIVG
jgi:hypothetical protein